MLDEKRIRKLYGENMWHLCRKLFPTILETEGLLSGILERYFYPSRFLYEDIVNNHLEDKFKEYIWNYYSEETERIDTGKTVKELLAEKGYILYECKTEEEIQSFRKYYEKGEVICTITERDRLDRCFVFFAVKENVDEIKRKDFKKPKRQDLYGTSVISIQFSRGENNGLSIKNRYNDIVKNPDATFSNNLDNINVGLTAAFEKEYGLNIRQGVMDTFDLPNYAVALNRKHYRYNCKIIPNTYYCPDNIIIANGMIVKKYLEKEKYLVFDCYILDLVNKKIISPDVKDAFVDTLKDIKDIKIRNIDDGKEVFIQFEDSTFATIVLDKYNRIVEYKNEKVMQIKDNFLSHNDTLKKLELPNAESIGNSFLPVNTCLVKLEISKVKIIGNDFMSYNTDLEELNAKEVETIGNSFLFCNQIIEDINFPKLVFVGDGFMCANNALKSVVLSNLRKIGDAFLYSNNTLQEIVLEKVEYIGEDFMNNSEMLITVVAPNLINSKTDLNDKGQHKL